MIFICRLTPDDPPVPVSNHQFPERHQFTQKRFTGERRSLQKNHLGEDIPKYLGVLLLQAMQICDRILGQPDASGGLVNHNDPSEVVKAGVDFILKFGPADPEMIHRLIEICADATVCGHTSHDQGNVSQGFAVTFELLELMGGDDGSDRPTMARKGDLFTGLS